MARKPYPSDVTDDEWDFVAPYLTLMKPQAPQRKHEPREVFNAMRWIVRTGSQWRYMPHDLPPWQAVYQQTQRWFAAGVFDAMTQDLRRILRILAGRQEEPSAAIFDSRTLQCTPESGDRAGYDGAKKKNGSKVHMAVDTLGYLLSLHVTPANKQDRQQVGKLARSLPGKCRSRRASRSSWRLSTKATLAKRQSRRPGNKRSNCRWSSCQRPNSGSYCCRGDGWWNEASDGSSAFVDWRRITNDWQPLSQACTWPYSR